MFLLVFSLPVFPLVWRRDLFQSSVYQILPYFFLQCLPQLLVLPEGAGKKKIPSSKSPNIHNFLPFLILATKPMTITPWKSKSVQGFFCPATNHLNQLRSHLRVHWQLTSDDWRVQCHNICFSLLPMSKQGAGRVGLGAPLGVSCTAIQLVLIGINWRDEGSERLPVSVSKGKNRGHLGL